MRAKPGADFDGKTYDRQLDQVRLGGLLLRVYNVMYPGGWWTLARIASKVGGSEASISARIRDLRKDKFGGYEVQRKRSELKPGLFYYRLVAGQGKLFDD